jgi:RNA-directed DNA polymerase
MIACVSKRSSRLSSRHSSLPSLVSFFHWNEPLRDSPRRNCQPAARQPVYVSFSQILWRITKRGEQFQARVVNYADDFVILSRGNAAEALEWTRNVVTRLGLTLNEAKTSIKQASKESFNFLGYSVLQKAHG